jgi:CTP synthase
MQVAVIEFARNVCGMAGANSSEFDEQTPYPVIDMMEEQLLVAEKGGTMRLGAYPCTIKSGTVLERVYGTREISERHRHRYEFNNAYREPIEAAGLVIGGTSPDGSLVEAVEIPGNDYFVAVQFHPEFKSRPDKPHPLFAGLIGAAKAKSQKA